MTMPYGILCLFPITVILVIAFFTKRTLFAMVCGLISAAAILGGFSGFAEACMSSLYASLSNESLQWILVMVSLFGILLSLLEKSGAVTDFGCWAGKFIKTKRSALIGSLLLGVVVCIDDYLNNLSVSTTMKGITDKHRIPRVQLGYIVNTVAAPICLLFPFSTWAVYFAALMGEQGVTLDGSPMAAYIHGLPFAFYGWFAVIVCILQLLGVLPKLGYMKKAWLQVSNSAGAETKSAASENKNAKPWNFLVPIACMIAVAIYSDVLFGAAVAVFVSSLMYIIEGKFKFKELLTACYNGILAMAFVLILCVLAFAVQDANVKLGLTEYVISITEPLMQGSFLPAVVFAVCAVYAYATGCFWDLAAIIIPIVIPLSNAMNVDPILTSAAVFSGAAIGSNTCLYGDGIIMCSQGCEIEPLDLMRATLPYAGIAGTAAFIAYLIAGFVH